MQVLLLRAEFAQARRASINAGAPAHLAQAAQQAGLDEVRHAQACFALASRFAEQPLGPAALPMQGVELSNTPAALAVAVLREGCIGEPLAAALARAQLEVVDDTACRAALEMIARDEVDKVYGFMAPRDLEPLRASDRRTGAGGARGDVA